MTDPAAVCMQPTAPIGPLRVAVDYYYRVRLEEEPSYRGGFHGSPNLVAEAVTGLLLRDRVAGPGDQAEIVDLAETRHGQYSILARLRRGHAHLPPRRPIAWARVEEIYRDFVSRVSKKRCPFAVHTVALYQAEKPQPAAMVSDVSRHAAALKAAGLASRLLALRAPSSPLVAVTTGRVSGDMVAALAATRVAAIVSNHHPVLSGLEEAAARGVALVMRRPDGVGLAAYTGHSLLEDAPRVAAGGGGGPGAYRGIPSPLC